MSRKERELVDAKRKKAQVEMEKETLEDTLTRMREADSWQRMSPRAPVLGIGDISLDSATSPMVSYTCMHTRARTRARTHTHTHTHTHTCAPVQLGEVLYLAPEGYMYVDKQAKTIVVVHVVVQ